MENDVIVVAPKVGMASLFVSGVGHIYSLIRMHIYTILLIIYKYMTIEIDTTSLSNIPKINWHWKLTYISIFKNILCWIQICIRFWFLITGSPNWFLHTKQYMGPLWLHRQINQLIPVCNISHGVFRDMGFNTLRARQNGRHFPDDIFNRIFLNHNVRIPINISPEFVPKGPINNIPALVQIMA